MSGMAGVFHRDGQRVEENALAGMRAVMAHRGPQGTHQWRAGRVGLAHCMMHTTPESLGEQLPLHLPGVDLAITADARIDNRAELAGALGLPANTAARMADSELILRAYRRWGRDCVHHLLGDFAFLVWDGEKGQLFGARDHMGVRPFLYHATPALFVAASEVRGVCAHPSVNPVFDERRIADFLVEPLEGMDFTSTFYTTISRLPPAHRITVSDSRLDIERYWRPDPEAELVLKNDGEYAEAFRAVLDQSVGARLRCNARVACGVSGGVDSSLVAAVARDLMAASNSGPLRVYSCIADNESVSLESRCIRQVFASGDYDPVTVSPSQIGRFEDTLRELFNHMEEPFDNHMTSIQLLYLLARERGDRVVLDGVEGDQCHSPGPAYPAYLLRRGHLVSALRELAGRWRNDMYPPTRSIADLVKQSIRPAFVPNGLRRWRSAHRAQQLAAGPRDASPISGKFAAAADLAGRLRRFRETAGIGMCRDLREQAARSATHPFLCVALERYNRVASVSGIEPRHPLLDKRLVEFSVSLPWRQKVRDGRGKYQLRRAADALLPPEIAWRLSWQDLGWEFTTRRMDLLGDTMRQTCVRMAPSLQRYIRESALQKALTVTVDSDQGGARDVFWEIYSLAQWLSRPNQPCQGEHAK